MPAPCEFLIVDDHLDNRFLLTKTLIRKYPTALVQECQDSQAALTAVSRDTLTAAIVHCAADMPGTELIELMRNANLLLPILYVSAEDNRNKGFRAGATAFLIYDAWLRVGTVVEDMLRVVKTTPPFADPTNAPMA